LPESVTAARLPRINSPVIPQRHDRNGDHETVVRCRGGHGIGFERLAVRDRPVGFEELEVANVRPGSTDSTYASSPSAGVEWTTGSAIRSETVG
jgi:hypothetical protein